MSPLKKRQRLMAEQQQQEEARGSGSSRPTLEGIQDHFADLIQRLQQKQQQQQSASSTPATESSVAVRQSFLQLAEWQRQLYETIEQQESKLAELTAHRIKAQRKEQAEAYERAHLQQQIDRRKNFATPYLDQLAREETGIALNESSTLDQAEILQQFLEADPNNTSHQQFIVSKLQECLQQRGALEKVLETKKRALQKVTEQVKAKNDFLKALPQHVKTLQRASSSLSKFIAQQSSAGVVADSVQHISGSTRMQRLEMAQKLPVPLYTIFALLQQYVDETVTSELQQQKSDAEVASSGSSTGNIRLLVNASIGTASNDEVVLQLPVEDTLSVTSNSKKRVSISFRFQDEPAPTITVIAKGCASTLNQDILLEELFPGDRSTGGQTKSYQWCNFLAGLYYAPVASSNDNNTQLQRLSTRIIVHELQKRVRANAAWKHILYSLQRNHVPVPPTAVPTITAEDESETFMIPSHDPTWKPACKLTSFEADEESKDTSLTTFRATLRLQTKTLSCSVKVDTVRYPAVPPVWDLLSSASSSSSSPTSPSSQLYDSRLAQLQQQVNQDALMRVLVDDADADETSRTTKVSASDQQQRYFEWILVHQLREIMHQWEQQSDEGGATVSFQVAGRMRKGRDRKLLK